MPQTRQEQIAVCLICDTKKGHMLMESLQGTATSSIFQTVKTNLRAQMYLFSAQLTATCKMKVWLDLNGLKLEVFCTHLLIV